MKWDVKRLQQQVTSNEEELKELKVHMKELKQNVERLAIAGWFRTDVKLIWIFNFYSYNIIDLIISYIPE